LAYRHLAHIYELQGDLPQAEQAFRRATAVLEQVANDQPGDAFYWHEAALTQHTFGLFLHKMGYPDASGQLRQARDKYDRAVALAADPRAFNNSAWFLITCPDVTLRDPAKAVMLMQALVAKDNDTRWLRTLGMAYYRVRNWPAAITMLEKSVELNSSPDGDTCAFLAMANWQLGKKAEALQLYAKMVEFLEDRLPAGEDPHGFRAEAAALLHIDEKSKEKPE
jgi:tetratricopeptide (TPR) repeat protein